MSAIALPRHCHAATHNGHMLTHAAACHAGFIATSRLLTPPLLFFAAAARRACRHYAAAPPPPLLLHAAMLPLIALMIHAVICLPPLRDDARFTMLMILMPLPLMPCLMLPYADFRLRRCAAASLPRRRRYDKFFACLRFAYIMLICAARYARFCRLLPPLDYMMSCYGALLPQPFFTMFDHFSPPALMLAAFRRYAPLPLFFIRYAAAISLLITRFAIASPCRCFRLISSLRRCLRFAIADAAAA